MSLPFRYFLIVIFCYIGIAKNFSQTTPGRYGRIDVEITKEKKPRKIYAKVKITSPFTNGDSSWVRSIENSINKTIKYKNGAKPGKYIVSVQFIVDKEGDISDVRSVSQPVGFGMEEQVLSAIKKKTKWLPSPKGVPVRTYRT